MRRAARNRVHAITEALERKALSRGAARLANRNASRLYVVISVRRADQCASGGNDTALSRVQRERKNA